MDLTGHPKEPYMRPCPGRDDMSQLNDDRCHPVKCTRQPDWTGKDCCHFWKASPNVWSNDIVRVDQVNPHKFNYDQYRYQIAAKPFHVSGPQLGAAAHSVPDRHYAAPTTDIRALKQTMYIPVLPHNPGGVTDFSFPMTPESMGQPDVTTSCCVPVIPCNPGFQNLTPSVRADPNLMCQTYNKCNQPLQIGPRRVNITSEMLRTEMPSERDLYAPPMLGANQQFFATPTNQAGGAYSDGSELFPEPQRPYGVPFPPQAHIPHHTEGMHDGQYGCPSYDAYSLGIGEVHDGVNPHPGPGTAYTSVKSLRHQDRLNRLSEAQTETQEKRIRRLKSMFGAFGSYLVPIPYNRRNLEGTRDTIIQQGNGFAWNYPKSENRLCYVVERNPRC